MSLLAIQSQTTVLQHTFPAMPNSTRFMLLTTGMASGSRLMAREVSSYHSDEKAANRHTDILQ